MTDLGLKRTGRGYILNVNPQGPDRIHDLDNLTESCNTDDVMDGQRIDQATGQRLIETAPADELERCKHCLRELRG